MDCVEFSELDDDTSALKNKRVNLSKVSYKSDSPNIKSCSIQEMKSNSVNNNLSVGNGHRHFSTTDYVSKSNGNSVTMNCYKMEIGVVNRLEKSSKSIESDEDLDNLLSEVNRNLNPGEFHDKKKTFESYPHSIKVNSLKHSTVNSEARTVQNIKTQVAAEETTVAVTGLKLLEGSCLSDNKSECNTNVNGPATSVSVEEINLEDSLDTGSCATQEESEERNRNTFSNCASSNVRTSATIKTDQASVVSSQHVRKSIIKVRDDFECILIEDDDEDGVSDEDVELNLSGSINSMDRCKGICLSPEADSQLPKETHHEYSDSSPTYVNTKYSSKYGSSARKVDFLSSVTKRMYIGPKRKKSLKCPYDDDDEDDHLKRLELKESEIFKKIITLEGSNDDNFHTKNENTGNKLEGSCFTDKDSNTDCSDLKTVKDVHTTPEAEKRSEKAASAGNSEIPTAVSKQESVSTVFPCNIDSEDQHGSIKDRTDKDEMQCSQNAICEDSYPKDQDLKQDSINLLSSSVVVGCNSTQKDEVRCFPGECKDELVRAASNNTSKLDMTDHTLPKSCQYKIKDDYLDQSEGDLLASDTKYIVADDIKSESSNFKLGARVNGLLQFEGANKVPELKAIVLGTDETVSGEEMGSKCDEPISCKSVKSEQEDAEGYVITAEHSKDEKKPACETNTKEEPKKQSEEYSSTDNKDTKQVTSEQTAVTVEDESKECGGVEGGVLNKLIQGDDDDDNVSESNLEHTTYKLLSKNHNDDSVESAISNSVQEKSDSPDSGAGDGLNCVMECDDTSQNSSKENAASSEDMSETADGDKTDKAAGGNKSGEEGGKEGETTGEVFTVGEPEVIDLDEEDVMVKRRKGTRCCNVECGATVNLEEAPGFVLSHFGLKYLPDKRQKVCPQCIKAVGEKYKVLSTMLFQRKPLLSYHFPSRNETVIITDSDDDAVTDDEEDEFLSVNFISDFETHIKEVFKAAWKNIDLNFQMEEGVKLLSTRLDTLTESFTQVDEEFKEHQRNVDKLRAELYKDHHQQRKELPPEDIVDNSWRPLQRRRLGRPVMDHRRQPVGVAMKRVTQVQWPPSSHRGNSSGTHEVQDVMALEEIMVTHKPLPPVGTVSRPRPRAGDVMYVMKVSYFGAWSRAKILEVIPKGTETPTGLSSHALYKIKFESTYRKSNPLKQVTGKQMAYPSPPSVRLTVGTRVIAVFRDNDWSKECYYSGIIAEPPKSMNNYRYLVFFDDGYAQYVTHEKVLLVCECSPNIWEDIHPDSREFIRKYLDQYPERPMVKLQKGQIVKTEWNGKWWIARVMEVDGSLVKMHFDADNRTEWIYRGSTRLGPLYAELANATQRKEHSSFSRHRGLGIASLKKRNMPYVEYTRGTDIEEVTLDDSGDHGAYARKSDTTVPVRAVARKSTTKRPSSNYVTQIPIAPDSPDSSEQVVGAEEEEPASTVVNRMLDTAIRPRPFRPHQCAPPCVSWAPYDPKELKGENPLIKPLLCAWRRELGRLKGKRTVLYRSPCGRRLRSLPELHRYLRITRSGMAVDMFDFDFWVHCFSEYVQKRTFTHIKDLSYGVENVPVPCVNYVDHSMPSFVNYSTKREPTDGVSLNLDQEFLTGCDCTDDCQDRDKCACWQLTIQGTAYGPGGAVDPSVGYIYKRLPEPVMTGIYECNARCKCSSTCLNRVAQQPLQLKLQVFKTENRGWGIRCLNDIPQGAFICIYAGNLLTEQGANEEGKNYGDEYLAELDYIEVVERMKEGYESDVVEDDDDDEPGGGRGQRGTPTTSSDVADEDTQQASLAGSHSDSSESEEEDEEEVDDPMDVSTRDSDEEFQPNGWPKTARPISREGGSYRTRLRKRTHENGGDSSVSQSDDEKRDHHMTEQKKARLVFSEDDSQDKVTGKLRPVLREDQRDASSVKPRQSFSEDSRDGLSSNYASDDEENDKVREPSRFSAVAELPGDVTPRPPKSRSVREFFGDDEYCYIMDAKGNGNIGRYLNHSCSPNVFVQNVFVDTHDLRFPWVAFFALTYIHAGTELTWDYNYDVGSVPGKALHCYCGSNDCRGRLL